MSAPDFLKMLDSSDPVERELGFAFAAAVCHACGNLPSRHCYPEPKPHEVEFIVVKRNR